MEYNGTFEHILNTVIRKQVDGDAVRFGFTPKKLTTDTIFTLLQAQEKSLSQYKNTCYTFENLKNAFECVR